MPLPRTGRVSWPPRGAGTALQFAEGTEETEAGSRGPCPPGPMQEEWMELGSWPPRQPPFSSQFLKVFCPPRRLSSVRSILFPESAHASNQIF